MDQLHKEAVEWMYERGFGGLENRVNCAEMAGEGRCSRSGKYRGVSLLNHVMKVLESILDGRTMRSVEDVETEI